MIKKTLYFGNPAYLSLKDSQMLIRLPEVERSTSVNADFKKRAERTIPIEDITASLAKCFEGEMRKICYPTF